MTSKNSYWNLSKWNMKKRSWVLAVCICVWFFALPVFAYFSASAYVHDIKLYGATPNFLKEMVWNIWQNNFYSILHIVITIILAVLMPIQAFSWTNNRQKVDVYKSVPVKESTRFIYIHVNSLLMFAVPMAVCLVLANLVTAFLGVFDIQYVSGSIKIFVTCILMYIAIYMLVLIAQLLTGNIVLAFFGGCFLLLAEPVCRLICWTYASYFYDTMYRGVATQVSLQLMNTISSPVATGICSFLSYRNIVLAEMENSYVYYRLGLGVVSKEWIFGWTLLLQALIYTACAYYLYKKRASQTGGKNIVFPKAIPIIKLAVIFVVSMGVGMITCSSGMGRDMEISYGLLGIVLSSIVLHVVLNAIIEGSLNDALKKMVKSLLISCIGCALACGLFSVYAFDLFHYNTYIPNEEAIESFAVVRSEDSNVTMDYVILNSVVSNIDSMQITDESAKKVLLQVLENAMERNEYNFDVNRPEYAQASTKETLGFQEDYLYDDAGLVETVSVKYNLKNGKEVYRSYCLKKTDARKIYAAIYGLPEYMAVYNPLCDDEIVSMIKDKAYKKEAKYIPYNFDYLTQGIGTSNLSQELLEKLCLAAKEDINERSYEEIVANAPIARIAIGCTLTDESNGRNGSVTRAGFTIPVYETDKRMIELLKQEELYQDLSVPLDEVYEIDVYYAENEYNSEKACQRRLVISSDDEVAERLLEAVVPLDAGIAAIDFDMSLKNQYLVVIKPRKGDEKRYGIYSRKFPEGLEEVMKNADIQDSWMPKGY